jgi:2-dehydro-3-deoxyphosphogluconate aldolase / (4S)-4-hydroxy-2-oxoglutarate aldolase
MNKLLTAHPIVPVVVIERIEDAVPLAEALVAGGLPVLEVTLRTDAAIPGIKQIIKHVPEAIVGSGTVNNASQFSVSEEIGCQFIVSPGSTDELLDAARASSTPFLPGVSSASEVMRGLDYGFDCFKFFPAEAVGGAALLKSFQGPFSNVRFCATGGIGLHNVLDYLALKNVLSVGGSWITATNLVRQKRWQEIELLAREAVEICESSS